VLNNKTNRGLKKQRNTQIAIGIDKFLTLGKALMNKKHMNQERCQQIGTHEPGKMLTSKSTWTKRGINEHEPKEVQMNKKARSKAIEKTQCKNSFKT